MGHQFEDFMDLWYMIAKFNIHANTELSPIIFKKELNPKMLPL